MEHHEIKKAVKDNYTKIVSDNCGCGCGCGTSNQEISKSLGYSDEEINNVPEANLGLGCGNPTAFAEMKEGHIVVDLGSGAGFDAFLAAKKVGKTGKVIGVDMTEAMLEKARSSAEKYGYTNVEFRHGDIEELPIDDSSVDIVISNCVINLAPDKSKVFKEAYRVLKPGGKLIASDIVLLAELTEEQREDPDLISCCVGGALLREDYLFKIQEAGFKVDIVHEDTEISKRQYEGIPLESLKFIAHK